MRLKYIIGILICLISLTNTALAIDLNIDNVGGAAVAGQTVAVSVSQISDSLYEATFTTSPKAIPGTSDPIQYYPQGWFLVAGLPEGAIVANTNAVTLNDNSKLQGYTVDPDGKIDGFQYSDGVAIVFTTADFTNDVKGDKENFYTVKVRYSGTFNNPNPVWGAHVAWGEDVIPGVGDSSAKFMGSDGGTSSIPEFPTVALPIAAILGLMFIFGRRKQE